MPVRARSGFRVVALIAVSVVRSIVPVADAQRVMGRVARGVVGWQQWPTLSCATGAI